MHESPHAVIGPKGLHHEVGECPRSAVWVEEWIKTYPDCMQTGMYARRALIPPEAQLSGLERRQNSAMGSSKTAQTVRDEGEKEAKVRTPQALAVGVCQYTAWGLSAINI